MAPFFIGIHGRVSNEISIFVVLNKIHKYKYGAEVYNARRRLFKMV